MGMGVVRGVSGPVPHGDGPAQHRHQRDGVGHRAVLPLVPAPRRPEHDALSGIRATRRPDSGRHQLLLRSGRPARHRAAVPPTVLVAALGALVGACVFAAVGRALVDDAYITLGYARTLGLHGGWGVYPGLPANTATSPLNVLLTGGATALTRDALAGTAVVLVATFAAAAAWLTRIGVHLGLPAGRAPVFGLALLATSPLLLSTVGLESYLVLTLLLGLAERALARRWWTGGAVAGLLVLTRPDLAVVALVAVAVAGRSWWRAALGAAAAGAPWFAWSWWSLGSAIPDTLLVKAGVRWGPWDYASGLELWWLKFPVTTSLVIVPALAGLAALPFWLRRPELRPAGLVLGLGALAHVGVMSALDVAPFHWYYAPSAGGLGLLAALSCARARRPVARVSGGIGAAALAAGCVLAVAAGPAMPPLTSNWATPEQYRRIAERLPTGAVIEAPGEVGTLAYYCDCRVLDGLVDRGSLAPLLEARISGTGGVRGWLLRLNYLHYHPSAPVPRDLRMTTRVVRGAGPTDMHTPWGPARTWSLVPAAPPPHR